MSQRVRGAGRRRERVGWAIALGASALLNAALWGAVRRALPPVTPARPVDRVAVELRVLPAPARPPQAEPPPVTPPAPSAPARRPGPGEPRAPATAGGLAGPGAAPGAASPAPSRPARGSAEWLAGEGLAAPQPGGDGRPGLGDWTPGSGRDLVRGGGAGSAGGRGAGGAGEGTAALAQARVAGTLAQAAALARAQTPDGYWSPLRERLAAGYAPDWTALEDGPKEPGGAGTRLGRTVQGYLAEAQRYARGDRLSDRDGVMGDRTGGAGDVVARRVAAASGGSGPLPTSMEQGELALHRTQTVLVRIVQRADGTVERVELAESSGNRALDRAALTAARRALAAAPLGPTPAQGRETVWAFTTRFGVIPPAPAVACPPDAIWRGDLSRCAWPMKRLVHSQVELREIY